MKKNNVKAILKLMIREKLNSFTKEKNKFSGSKIVIAIMVLVIILELSYLYNKIAVLSGTRLLIEITLIITSIFTIIISIPTILSNMFQPLDIIMFGHLPVNKEDIIFSRLWMSLTKVMIVSFGCGVEALIVGIVTGRFSAIIALLFLIILIINSVLVVGIISGLLLIIFKIEKLIKVRAVITSLFSIIIYVFILGVIVIFQFAILQELFNNHAINVQKLINILSNHSEKLFEKAPFYWFTNILIAKDFKSIITIIAMLIISISLILIIAKLYISEYDSLENLLEIFDGTRGINSNMTSSLNNFLLKREWWIIKDKTFFIYQLIQGILIPPIALTITIILLFNIAGVGESHNIFKVLKDFRYLDICAIDLIVAMSTINVMLPTSVSREGKYFYISKTIPVSYGKQYNFKVIFGAITSYISILMIFIILLLMKFPLKNYPMVILISLELAILINIISLIFDLKKPNIQWENPQGAINGNINSTLHMLLVLIVLTVLSGVIMLLDTMRADTITIEIIITIVVTLITIISYKYVQKRIVKYYDNIE